MSDKATLIVQVDDVGDLIVEISWPKRRIGFVLSRKPNDSGWYGASSDRSSDGSGPLSQEQLKTILEWAAAQKVVI